MKKLLFDITLKVKVCCL